MHRALDWPRHFGNATLGNALAFSMFYGFGGDCPGSMGSWGSDTRGCAAGVEFRQLNPRLGEYFGAESGIFVIDVDDDSAGPHARRGHSRGRRP